MLDDVLLGNRLTKAEYDQVLPGLRTELLDLQFEVLERARFPVILLISGVKTAGRSETVNELLGWLDPRSVRVEAETAPTTEERERPPLYRHWRALPPRGQIGVFHGGWYADLWAWLDKGTRRSDRLLAYEHVKHFEQMLAADGALVLKVLLHISPKEQRRRLKKWAKDPHTRFWLSEDDWQLAEKAEAVHDRLQEALVGTDHAAAPWTVIDATDERYREIAVARLLVDQLRARLQVPEPARPEPPPLPPPPVEPNPISVLDLSQKLDETSYDRQLKRWRAALAELTRQKEFPKLSVVSVFEGVDAAGKGGAIRRVTNSLDARLYRVVRIAKPTDEEAAQPWLWRFWRHLPRRGHLAVFDRSWYGRVLVERVEGFCHPHEWQRAYEEINDFESMLDRNRIVVVKFWLQISKEEQLRRFEARRDTPYKRQKLTDEDWRNRDKWDAYSQAVIDMVERTSTQHARWTLVEAEDKLFARVKVLKTLCKTIEQALD